MERYNPFSSSNSSDDTKSYNEDFNGSVKSPGASNSNQSLRRNPSEGITRDTSIGGRFAISCASQASPVSSTMTFSSTKYSTAFPDPFGDSLPENLSTAKATSVASSPSITATTSINPNRSNTVTFAAPSRSVDDPVSAASSTHSSRREPGGISSFLSRATSVTSSTVTDRVTGAVGSVRSAVDSISSQIQQAVPTNLNERLSSTATNIMSNSEQQQQSAASYLASRLSSATNQFTSSSPSSSSLPLISRQRVILILDNSAGIDWSQQFSNYRRLASGLGPASGNALTSFFSSATAQLTSSSSSASQLDGIDLVEQADFRDVSILANQATLTVTVLVTSNTSTGSGTQSRLPASNKISTRIIRPEYVVVRQKTKNGLEHMRGIVTALNYCLVPMLEPIDVWNIFQDRLLVFSRLLRIQKLLGKENFPLIPQVYCQTHQDFLNYVNNSSVNLPCLVRTGQSGTGKIKMDNVQMMKDFASIVATSNLSCTVEPYLDVKCNLVVQKIGSNLKLFRKSNVQSLEIGSSSAYRDDPASGFDTRQIDRAQDFARQPAARQTSLGTGVLSSLISSTTNQSQQNSRRNSQPNSSNYEKLAEVNTRYKSWVEAISREFADKLDVFCIKLVVTNHDREYIVGLNNCSMDFLGSSDSQEEDKSSFVEMIINNMNAVLPETGDPSKEQSIKAAQQSTACAVTSIDRHSSAEDRAALTTTSVGYQSTQDASLVDKKKFTSQAQINGFGGSLTRQGQTASVGQMGNRSQSVSINQSDYMVDREAITRSIGAIRRGSDRSDSFTNESSTFNGSSHQTTIFGEASSSGLHRRQASLGQSFFDQTSTAFNTLQKQSMNFFKRLDSRAGELGSNTLPQSAKSDKGFERANDSNDDIIGIRKNGFKSQSIDSCALDSNKPQTRRETPPKPPPPQCLGNRQSSLAAYSTQTVRQTASTTPMSTRQNSAISFETYCPSSGVSQKARVVRQNSALSAFEPFDPDLQLHLRNEPTTLKETTATNSSSMSRALSQQQTDEGRLNKQLEPVKRSSNLDSASITSGDSNSTSETTTAEDTMNNLKKTFASIFGDKCE